MSFRPIKKYEKIGIIGGAGGLGSTMAFYLGLKDLAQSIALFDVKENVLATHVIDMRECFSEECQTVITGGGWDALAGSQVVIMAASLSGRQVNSRNDYLAANLNLVLEVSNGIAKCAPDATLISCTAPVDAYVMIFQRELGWDRHRILGFCRNDSLRFRYALSEVLGFPAQRLGGLVLGEHGESQLPLFSSVTLDGEPLELSQAQEAATERILRDWYSHWQSHNSGRTTTWTSATSMAHILEALRGNPDPKGLVGSVLLEGEYGLSGVSLGVPLEAGEYGWSKVIELNLSPREKERLTLSSEKVRSLYRESII
jgi:malate/lactate dehydrogenase